MLYRCLKKNMGTAAVAASPNSPKNMFQRTQQILQDFNLDEIISGDEMGVNYGAQPLNLYVPMDAERGTAPPSDDKARITAMLWGMANGEMDAASTSALGWWTPAVGQQLVGDGWVGLGVGPISGNLRVP